MQQSSHADPKIFDIGETQMEDVLIPSLAKATGSTNAKNKRKASTEKDGKEGKEGKLGRQKLTWAERPLLEQKTMPYSIVEYYVKEIP
jgi:hypothetical protein